MKMTNETMTSVDALNVNTTEPSIEPAKPTEAKLPTPRKPRALPAKPTAAQLQAEINKLREAKRIATEAERSKKPARRSKTNGNTWQIKLIAAANPSAKLDVVCKLAKPKLVKNDRGFLPSDATIGTIRTDFYHSARVIKQLTDAQRKALFNAI